MYLVSSAVPQKQLSNLDIIPKLIQHSAKTDKPVELIKGTNKIQNCSKIALSKGIGKDYGITFLVWPHRRYKQVGTFHWPPVYGPPQWTTKMDYPNELWNGLPKKNWKKYRKKFYPLVVCFDWFTAIQHLVFISRVLPLLKTLQHIYIVHKLVLLQTLCIRNETSACE